MSDTITDEEFFDLLDDFAGPMVEMEWTMSDEEYESWCHAQQARQRKERRKREETREERLDRLYTFYNDEHNVVNERSPFDQ